MDGSTDLAGDAVGDVLDVLAATAPEIRAGLADRSTADGENPSGETQLAADVRADRLLEERLSAVEGVGAYASEEREAVVDCGDGLSVAVDPLDGSSNLACNNPMGTILGVYDAELPAPGRDLVAAAYVLYGPLTTMVVARDGAVTEYVVEESGAQRTSSEPQRSTNGARRISGEAVSREEDVTLPDEPVVYGFGGRVPDWTDAFSAYAADVESELKLRYGGAMVGDVNQVLTYGGVFCYPALDSRPEGKLRLQFEGAPMAYVVETAGGASSDGERSLLAVEPDDLHQRTPVHLGTEELIERLEAALT